MKISSVRFAGSPSTKTLNFVKRVKAIFVCAVLSSSAAFAEIEFSDVLQAPPEFLDISESALWKMADELGIRGHVSDLAIVGSMACGIARLNDAADPSDIDFLVYVMGTSFEPYKQSNARIVAKYEDMLRHRLQSQLPVQIIFSIDTPPDPNDPNIVRYSLIERKMYNRPGNKKRNLKGFVHKKVFYAHDRDQFMKLMERKRKENLKVHVEVIGDRLIWYDRTAWERGEKRVLLKSLPKR